MATRSLTDRTIKALENKPAKVGTTYDVRDGVVPGLHVRVMPSGQRTFVLVARFGGSKNPTRRRLGAYGELTLEEARQKARHWLDLIGRGVDPKHEEERQRQAALRKQENSFAVVSEEFIKRHASKLRKSATIERELRHEFISRWGDRPITDISQHDVVSVLDAAVDRGAFYQAHNLLGHCRGLFNWALARGIYGLEKSPCDRLKPQAVIGRRLARQRILSDDEVRALWAAAEAMRYPYGPLLKMLLITGQRRSEVSEARWSEFDLAKKLWVIPPARMKTNAAHEVPLSDEAMKVLVSLPRFNRGDALFSSTYGVKPVNGFARAKEILDREMTARLPIAPSPYVLHDIRRSVRTHLSALPIPDLVRELVISHTKPGLHRVYDQHRYIVEKRHALDLWGARLRDIVQPAPDNIV